MEAINTEQSLLEAIFTALHKHPDNPGLKFRHSQFTYQQINQDILQLTQVYIDSKLAHQHRIGVMLSRHPVIVPIILSIWNIQAVYVPLDSELPKNRLAEICIESNLDIIVTEQKFIDTVSRVPYKKLYLDHFKDKLNLFQTGLKENKASAPDTNTALQTFQNKKCTFKVQLDELAYILHTSGSTGKPKAVKITHRNLTRLLISIFSRITFKRQSIFYGVSRFSFDISIFELIAPYLLGGKLVLADEETHKNPQQIVNQIKNLDVDVFQATPGLWTLLFKFGLKVKSRDAIAISTGDALSKNIALQLQETFAIAWNLYGPTECTIWSTAKKIDNELTIGTALDGYHCNLIDNNKNIISETNIRGELCISGEAVSIDCTHPSGQYYTGDICYWNKKWELVFCGRKDNQLKINGYRIEAEEIEHYLEQHNSIEQAIVTKEAQNENSHNNTHGDRLIAYLKFKSHSPNKDAKAFNRHLKRNIPAYMIPDTYRVLNELQIDANGKKKRNMPQPALIRNDPNNSENSTARGKITIIFCTILDIKKINTNESFFDAGGNSMLVASLLLAINAEFKSELTLKELLSSPPTVDRIYRLLANTAG